MEAMKDASSWPLAMPISKLGSLLSNLGKDDAAFDVTFKSSSELEISYNPAHHLYLVCCAIRTIAGAMFVSGLCDQNYCYLTLVPLLTRWDKQEKVVRGRG